MNQQLVENKHKSTIRISLMAWNIALSNFYNGFCLVYLGALPFETIISIYKIDINQGVAQGILNGCVPVGALFGSLASTLIIQRFSRRKNVLVTNVVSFLIGILLYIPNFYSFLFFRFLQGVCVGILTALAPLIISQITPISLSGRLPIFIQINISGGLFISFFCTYALKKITNNLDGRQFWQILFGIPLPILIFQSIVLMFVFPYQTPKYLLLKNKQTQCVALLQVIYKPQYVQQILQQKKNDLKHFSSLQKINTESTLTELTDDDYAPPPPKKSQLANLMAIHIVVFQQFCGVNAINVYCSPILSKITSGELAMLTPSLLSFLKVLLTLTTTIIISRFGRKSLIQLGTILLLLANILITVGFALQNNQSQSAQPIIIFGLFFYIASYGLTIGPLTWVFVSDTASPTAMAFVTASLWIASSTLLILFPIIDFNVLNGDPTLLFGFFAFYCLGSVIINRLFLVETKGKTHQQIRQAYIDHKVC